MPNNLKDSQDPPASEKWFISKLADGTCEIIKSDRQDSQDPAEIDTSVETWGAFASQGEAIAKRVGLIRAGKCQPR
jgi:hypothetical protein